MKVYLAGKITGTDDYHKRFAVAADKLRNEGHSVFNPAASNQEGRPLNKIMAHVLPQLCDCEAIALLPGWRKSGGAVIEFLLAKYLKLEIIYLKALRGPSPARIHRQRLNTVYYVLFLLNTGPIVQAL